MGVANCTLSELLKTNKKINGTKPSSGKFLTNFIF